MKKELAEEISASLRIREFQNMAGKRSLLVPTGTGVWREYKFLIEKQDCDSTHKSSARIYNRGVSVSNECIR